MFLEKIFLLRFFDKILWQFKLGDFYKSVTVPLSGGGFFS